MCGVLDVRWAHSGIVTMGHYCTGQGIVGQTGQLGVALITLVRLLFYCLWSKTLMYTSPAPCCPHLRDGAVETRYPGSTWSCPWPGLPRLPFHCALGLHWHEHSLQGLRNALTGALFNFILYLFFY